MWGGSAETGALGRCQFSEFKLLSCSALGKVWLSDGFPGWGPRGLLSQGAAEIGLLEMERWVYHCPSATRASWVSTISSVANTRMSSLAGRACPGLPSSQCMEVSLPCSTWTQAAFGVLLEHSYGPWVTKRLPNMPSWCMVLRQVCPGRSTKKFLLERGRAGRACAANSPLLSHQQPWAGLKGVCAHFTDSLVTLDLWWGNGVHSSADKNCKIAASLFHYFGWNVVQELLHKGFCYWLHKEPQEWCQTGVEGSLQHQNRNRIRFWF